MSNEKLSINHHKQLLDGRIVAINKIKDIEQSIFEKISNIYEEMQHSNPGDIILYDFRWKSIGKTHIQEAFMAFIRSIAKPDEPEF